MTDQDKDNLIKWVVWFAAIFSIVVLCTIAGQSQEQYIRACQQSYACQLDQGVPWSSGVRTYVFTPTAPDVSLRIFVHNNNTTSAHTAQTITLWITNSTVANASLIGQSDIWVQAAIIDNTTAGAKCTNVNKNQPAVAAGANGSGSCYSQGMYAAQMAIQFTPGGTQAGSPDTFDLAIVQCTGVHCNYPGGPQPGSDSSAGGVGPQGDTSLTNFPSAGLMVFNGSNWDRVRGSTVIQDGLSQLGLLIGANYLSRNTIDTTWDAEKSQSQNTATQTSTLDSVLPGMPIVTAPATWNATNQGTATQCSASVAASATAKKHFITGCTVCVSAGATPQTPIFANLRDGATGAGTVKWAGTLAAVTNAGQCVQFNGLSSGVIAGSSNTAATCELSAASAATVACTASIQGYDQ